MPAPATESDLLAFLTTLDIETQTHYHAPAHTVAEAQHYRGDIKGGHCKCLFVRDKKKRMALLVVEENKTVDLKSLADTLGFARLSFASPDRLFETLGVRPGSVTPFALLNRRIEKSETPPVRVILDEDMLNHRFLNYHPLHNAATTSIKPGDLLKFINACGYDFEITTIP